MIHRMITISHANCEIFYTHVQFKQSFPKKAYMWYQALFSTYKKRLFVTFYIILSVLTNKKIVRDNSLGNLVNGYWHNFDRKWAKIDWKCRLLLPVIEVWLVLGVLTLLNRHTRRYPLHRNALVSVTVDEILQKANRR